MTPLRTSVVIPAWNGERHLEACLQALLAQGDAPDEVIVVDNASVDGSATVVREQFPSVRLICNETNLGFSGGCNVGIAAAQGEIVVLLNQDAVVEAGWLQALMEAMHSEPAVGIAGGKAFYPDGRLQHAGGFL